MIAHQGGWDEMLLVLGPIVVIIGLLVLARKRVEASQRNAFADRDRLGTVDETSAEPPTPTP
jgi:hypothetical protein